VRETLHHSKDLSIKISQDINIAVLRNL